MTANRDFNTFNASDNPIIEHEHGEDDEAFTMFVQSHVVTLMSHSDPVDVNLKHDISDKLAVIVVILAVLFTVACGLITRITFVQ